MEAVGSLASPKNATIVVVASCCSIKLISYLAGLFYLQWIFIFSSCRGNPHFLGIAASRLLSTHNKIYFGSLVTGQTPLPRVLIDFLAGKVKSLKRATF